MMAIIVQVSRWRVDYPRGTALADEEVVFINIRRVLSVRLQLKQYTCLPEQAWQTEHS